MSALKKKDILKMPPAESAAATPKSRTDTQAELRMHKAQSEKIREVLQKRIIDNPGAAKKAAILIASWLDRPKKSSKR